MKYYLILQENQLQIIPVMPEQQIEFVIQFAQQINTSGKPSRKRFGIFISFH